MSKLPRMVSALVATSTLLLAACTGDDGSSEENTGDGAPDQVTYLTSLGNFGRESHVYCAQEQGYFAENNIEVEIQPGEGTQTNLEYVVGGSADFALADMGGVTVAAGTGQEGFRAIAAVDQTTQAALMTLDPEITTPQDLEGKVLGTLPAGVMVLILPTYAEFANFNLDAVERQQMGGAELPGAMVAGQLDAIALFATGEPLLATQAEGQEVTVLPFSDFIADLYGIGLVTRTEHIEQNPDLVQRFREAFLRGVEFALDNPEECAEIAAANGGFENAEITVRELQIVESYARSGDTPVGTFDPQRVAQMIATLEGVGAFPAGLTPEDVVAFDVAPQP